MDSLASMAAVASSKLLSLIISLIHPSSIATVDKSRSHLLSLLRGCLLLALHAFLFLLRVASFSLLRGCLLLALHAFLFLLRVASFSLSRAFDPNRVPPNHDPHNLLLPLPEEETTRVSRALSRVLAAVTRTRVSSRKYERVRTLAGRLLDDNLACGAPALVAVNRAALSAALALTLRRLEAAVALRGREAGGKADGSVGRILGGVRTRLRRWADAAEEEDGGGDPDEGAYGGGEWETAEKLAAEVMWLAEKMAACGAAGEAAARWGAAAGLARLALAAEPRLQGAFVRISVFLFKHANGKELEGSETKEQGTMATAACHQLDMLTSWLPLLCRATNGMDAPILSRLERAEMEGVLEEIIEKLSWDQQEDVLSLWLHHFTACPDSDWPNLQPCYVQWYDMSREQLLAK